MLSTIAEHLDYMQVKLRTVIAECQMAAGVGEGQMAQLLKFQRS